MPVRRTTAVAVALVLAAAIPAAANAPRQQAPDYRPHVVVATLDTGTNPFHPTWRRDETRHPSAYLPGYPASAPAARLAFRETYAESVEASAAALEAFAGDDPVWVPGTNLVGTWAHHTDRVPVFDARQQPLLSTPSHGHGAQASSQIAGTGFGLAEDAYLVVMDRTADGGADVYSVNAQALRWAADQPWIDIIHTNIQNPVPLAKQNTPPYPGYPDAVAYAMSKGKLVVSAAGNFYAEPTETSPHAGPSGVLVAGANDNCGFSDYSNPNPHVVMDGSGTDSAEPAGFGKKSFGGTSSASPRITGYVAQLLLELRRHYGYTGGIRDGALLVLRPAQRPSTGPLADGRLTAAELHEVVRKTANPQSHQSRFDGTQSASCVPQAVTGAAAYPKIGYGEVSEHTLGAARDVLLGSQPLPARPDEDQMYNESERARKLFWG